MSVEAVNNLIKAIEAGSYDAAPSTLNQGASLQIEDLSAVMNNVTFDTKHLKLQKLLGVKSSKSTTYQFVRQLSVGKFGGSAQWEGNLGQEETSDYVRAVVPMAYYSEVRRVTFASQMVATVDGKESSDRAAEDAALRLAGDIEFDSFLGGAHFSNAGVFDGNPAVVPSLPNLQGIDLQVRQSDVLSNAKDLMFSEYGSNESVVISAGGVAITQDKIEDIALRNNLNMGSGSELVVDPVALAGYNRISFGKDRIVLAGAPQEATGAHLGKQWVANGGTINLSSSIFLRGKYAPQATRPNGPGAPSIALGVSGTGNSIPAGTYFYGATTVNEVGESAMSTAVSQAVAAGERVTVTITHPGAGTFRYFNVYRGTAGGTAATMKFIGRVMASTGATTVFTDSGNRVPASTCGYLMDETANTEIRELAPFSRKKMALNDLSEPEAFFRFCCVVVPQPRKLVVLDNVRGTL